jgi:mannose-6-phosphate isomerase-like protein (cupin superfamily)
LDNATNIKAQFQGIREYWSPKVIGRVNDQYLKVAKLQGVFTWHDHEDEDELFCVVKGQMVIEFEDGKVALREGEFFTVPRGIRHRPVTEEECWVLLIESVTTKHTGNVDTPLTRSIEEQLR